MSPVEVDFDQVRQHLYDVVVLDTNILRSIGFPFDSAWFSELCEICKRADVPIAVIDITLDEWTIHYQDMLQTKSSQASACLRFIAQVSGTAVALPGTTLPDNSAIKQFLKSQLEAQEVRIVQTQPQGVTDYIEEALHKVSPFEQGGKGFVDAVILDSIVAYAKTLKSHALVLVVSDDTAVLRSRDRFDRSGVEVEFAKRGEAIEKASTALSRAWSELYEQRDAALLKLARESESLILEEIKEKPLKISKYSLRTALEEAKLGSLLPERIVGLRPQGVDRVKVLYGYPESVTGPDRYRVYVYVMCEVDVVLRKYLFSTANPYFEQTTITVDGIESPLGFPIESPKVSGDEAEATHTILMPISIDGSIARAAFEDGVCEDFRIEPELSLEQYQQIHRHLDELQEAKQE